MFTLSVCRKCCRDPNGRRVRAACHRERARFELRFEAFNVANSPEFSNPSATFGTAAFGSITSTSVDNRETQLGAKLVW